jgi:hypothetical protein
MYDLARFTAAKFKQRAFFNDARFHQVIVHFNEAWFGEFVLFREAQARPHPAWADTWPRGWCLKATEPGKPHGWWSIVEDDAHGA